MRTLVIALVLSICHARAADACQYVRTSIFALYESSDVVAAVTAGKLTPDGMRELTPSKVLKHSAGAAPRLLRVAEDVMCDVRFDQGKPYLVFVDDKRNITGLGNGVVRAPSAAVID